MHISNPRYCHWCQESRAEWYTYANHTLVCSPRCSRRKRGWNFAFLRLVDPHKGQSTVYISPEEYDDLLDAAVDAMLQEYHPHLLRSSAPVASTPLDAVYREGDFRARVLDGRHNAGGRRDTGAMTDGPSGARPSTQQNHDANRPAPLADILPLQGIIKTPDFGDGSARIEGTNVPVWMLIDAQLRGASAEDMQDYWGITSVQIDRALAYWDEHAEEIQDDLRRHQEKE